MVANPPLEQFTLTAGAEPIVLGSILLTVVEPHRGHEVAYNRWYERDHFYAGCMVGAYQFAGKRFVATAPLKALRPPQSTEITGEEGKGSYVACYFVLDGYHDYWNAWAVAQVNQLHAKGRMFAERDHVHTLLYDFRFEARRDADGVPIELALDHPFAGFVPVWVDLRSGVVDDESTAALTTQVLEPVMAGTPLALVGGFTPQALRDDAPSDVPRATADPERVLLLCFLERSPLECFDETIGALEARLEATGVGRLVGALPFIPTVPGTDRYTDELWTTA